MKLPYGRAIVGLCLSWMLSSELHAGVIYSNLGAGDSFIVNREYDVNSNFMATPCASSPLPPGDLNGRMPACSMVAI